ncbi:MAG: phosphate ABC transporter substrate-binding protein [Gammaproteobacteria bacterium]|nr:phosphate ABC transporter substrate-binding protein [Gammaproteobacteria bacterium]MCB1923002.1 phosphate ABC transporter substrate-binding protein [Gammaproteobacteria bacterium]
MKRLIACLGLCISLTTGGVASADDTGPLVWAGCGITKKAFMGELATAYKRRYGVEIVLEGGGATKGIRRISKNEVDIGGACRPILPGNAEETGVKLIPVAWDALVVMVHKDNPVDDISMDQLRNLYDGKITNWKQLGGPDRPIDLLIRKGKISGVGRTLRELVFNDTERDFVSKHVFPSSGPLEQALETNINAIGVTGISSALKRDVKLLKLEGREPSYDNVRTGTYLLYRPLYIVTNLRNPRYREVQRFVDFAHTSEGRDIIRRAGAVPYLDALRLVLKQREQWKNARATDALN